MSKIFIVLGVVYGIMLMVQILSGMLGKKESH